MLSFINGVSIMCRHLQVLTWINSALILKIQACKIMAATCLRPCRIALMTYLTSYLHQNCESHDNEICAAQLRWTYSHERLQLRLRPVFHGSCRVSMANGTGTKLVKDIQTGDVVVATSEEGLPCKSTAKVLRILKTKCLHGMATLVTLKSGLKVTEWHPVRRGGSWCFPASLGKACEAL